MNQNINDYNEKIFKNVFKVFLYNASDTNVAILVCKLKKWDSSEMCDLLYLCVLILFSTPEFLL